MFVGFPIYFDGFIVLYFVLYAINYIVSLDIYYTRRRINNMVAPLLVMAGGALAAKFASDVLTPDSDRSDFAAAAQKFPPNGYGGVTSRGMQIPVSINFCADVYENKQMFRENAIKGNLADITLPLPNNLTDDTQINYARGQAETTGGIWDMTPGGWRETWRSWFGLKTLASDFLGTSSLYAQRPMDESDNIYKGAELRKHSYAWILIPKNETEGAIVDSIVKTFQRMAYPMASNDEIYSRVIHPPIWQIRTFDYINKNNNTWVIDPLPSSLTSVSIQTADGSLHQTQGGYPAATALKVNFAELEPAINTGEFLQSRSQLRGGAARGGEGEQDVQTGASQ